MIIVGGYHSINSIERRTFMIYVGIDIAKLNHYASAISSDGEVLLEPFKFTNDNDGFYTLVSKLNQFEKDKVIIGLESTAHYGNNLLAFLVPKGYNVCLINSVSYFYIVRYICTAYSKYHLPTPTSILLLYAFTTSAITCPALSVSFRSASMVIF